MQLKKANNNTRSLVLNDSVVSTDTPGKENRRTMPDNSDGSCLQDSGNSSGMNSSGPPIHVVAARHVRRETSVAVLPPRKISMFCIPECPCNLSSAVKSYL